MVHHSEMWPPKFCHSEMACFHDTKNEGNAYKNHPPKFDKISPPKKVVRDPTEEAGSCSKHPFSDATGFWVALRNSFQVSRGDSPPYVEGVFQKDEPRIITLLKDLKRYAFFLNGTSLF